MSWRAQDLLYQSLVLFDIGHLLGARILLRSAFETVAVLIYLNQETRKVLDGALDFHDFSDKTETLLLGSRDESTPHKSLNIVTILEKCDTRYPGLAKLYATLSESAHPNYEGASVGYSDIDRVNHVVHFSNKWHALFGERHVSGIELCMSVFNAEYNDEWSDSFEKLEAWIECHDAGLEATKRN